MKVHIGPCYLLVPHKRLLRCFYFQTEEHKDSDIISICRKRASKMDTTQGRTFLPIPTPTEQGFQSEDIEKRRQGQPCATKRSIAKTSGCFQFTCTTACELWYIMLIHLRNSGRNTTVSKTVANKPMVNPIEDFGLIQLDQCGFGAIF